MNIKIQKNETKIDNTQRLSALRNGEFAFRCGVFCVDNPYPYDGEEYDWWLLGWEREYLEALNLRKNQIRVDK